MGDRVKTIFIGVFIIVACITLVGMLLFLRPSVGDGKKTLFVCFTSVEKIEVGTRVTFAGKPVGEVVSINPIYDARMQSQGRDHICFYELELKVDSHTVVYTTDEIAIHTTGLLGERTIAIIPKAILPGEPSFPVTNQMMYGQSSDPIEAAIHQLSTIGSKISTAVDRISDLMKDRNAEIPKTLRALERASSELAQSFGELNATHTMVHLSEVVKNLEGTSRNLDRMLASWKDRGLDKSVPALFENLASITEALNDQDHLHTLTENISATFEHLKDFTASFTPESTIGKLFTNDGLYLQLTALMTKANILFDDINNYGILFHTDKSWQRERMRRISLLQCLVRPQDFQSYFDCELNKIYLALCRISMSLQKAKCQRCPVLQDPCFKEGFADLLQRMSNMQDGLKTYREGLQ